MSGRIHYGERLRIGLIIPHPNVVAEPDFHAVLPEGVSVHTSRLRFDGTSPEQLEAASMHVGDAARLLGFKAIGLIAFHCTAISTLGAAMGERLTDEITRITGTPAVSTAQALLAAVRCFDATRIVMVTPYVQSVNDSEIRFFADAGIQVISDSGMTLAPGVSTASVTPDEWIERVRAMRHPQAQLYFLSCTNIKVLDIVDTLERELGKPVITSNQACIWHSLRSAGITDAVDGYGALLRDH